MAQKNQKEKIQPDQADQIEKPTKEQLQKVKKKPTKEKKEKWPFKIEEEEKTKEEKELSASPGGDEEETGAVELEEICGNLWVVLYQLGGILKKGFEPLTPDVKKLLSPPSARLAKKYHVETYMKDEIMLAGILGIDISKRLITLKKKKEKEIDTDDNRQTG